MSGSPDAEPVRSAIPVADLGVIDAALAAGGDALKEAVKKVRPADLGRDLSRRDLADCHKLLEACDPRRATAMLLAAHPAVSAHLIGELEVKRAAALLEQMPTDHQSAILGLLDAEQRKRIEEGLDEDSRKTLQRLLAYPESAVGRLMTPKVWRCEVDQTAGAALERLKADETIEVAVNCYVVDKGALVGVAALRELAVLPPETPLREAMVEHPIAVNEKTERGDAAEIIQVHDFLSLPVIDDAGRLVGAVRVDDLLDAALAKVGVGVLNQGGVAGKVIGNIPYFQTSMRKVVRSRITWLVLLFVAETGTGTVLRYFGDELAKVVALSFFIPLLIGTGGNAGSQTVSTVIRALALGEARIKDWMRVLFKEATTGFAVGSLLGIIGFCRSLLWGVGTEIALCVALTILVICTWANTVGAVIPIIAQRFKVDPTVVSAPAITTLVDATGLFIYFSIAAITVSALHQDSKEHRVWSSSFDGLSVAARFGNEQDGGKLGAWKRGDHTYLEYVAYHGDQFEYGWGEIPATALTGDDQKAHLLVSVTPGNGFTVEGGSGADLDLTWTGTGAASSSNDGTSRTQIGKYTFEAVGTWTGASASVQGSGFGESISAGGVIEKPADPDNAVEMNVVTVSK